MPKTSFINSLQDILKTIKQEKNDLGSGSVMQGLQKIKTECIGRAAEVIQLPPLSRSYVIKTQHNITPC